jgi:uncharacterized protein YjiS (DUF1127 family)
MTTLTASALISSYSTMDVYTAPRLGGLRALFGRMADASRAAASRRAMTTLSEHMLRDLGLTRGDLDGL